MAVAANNGRRIKVSTHEKKKEKEIQYGLTDNFNDFLTSPSFILSSGRE